MRSISHEEFTGTGFPTQWQVLQDMFQCLTERPFRYMSWIYILEVWMVKVFSGTF